MTELQRYVNYDDLLIVRSRIFKIGSQLDQNFDSIQTLITTPLLNNWRTGSSDYFWLEKLCVRRPVSFEQRVIDDRYVWTTVMKLQDGTKYNKWAKNKIFETTTAVIIIIIIINLFG